MKPILWLSILLASCAYADEATDRAAIKNVIATLNTPAFGPGLFTAGFNDFPELARLGVSANTSSPIMVTEGQSGRVVISHEPWGEATVGPTLTIKWVTSRFAITSTGFISEDVALVDAINEQSMDDSTPPKLPVLFVLKKEGTVWRIASLRLIAQPATRNALVMNR